MANRIVVTGSSGAVGGAVVARLAQVGDVLTSEVDLADFKKAREWAQKVGQPVNGLVALAGGFRMHNLGEIDDAQYGEVFDMNARTAFSTLNAFAEYFADGAAVVLVGSQSYKGAKNMSTYAAAKAAVVSLAKSAALEWDARHIRVNVILPDIIDTPANRAAMPDADYDKWQKPSEIAEVIAFLLSKDAVIVNGNLIELGR